MREINGTQKSLRTSEPGDSSFNLWRGLRRGWGRLEWDVLSSPSTGGEGGEVLGVL